MGDQTMHNDDVLARVKRLLSISDDSKDDILTDFIHSFRGIIRFHAGIKSTDIIPDELEWILTETVVARYQMIGSEHLKSEKVDLVSNTFRDDVLSPYLPFIKSWKEANAPADPDTTNSPRGWFL